jgi:hypothetical protein
MTSFPANLQEGVELGVQKSSILQKSNHSLSQIGEEALQRLRLHGSTR